MERKTFSGLLTGNQLKILALLSMTLDHIGLQLYPQVELLRILGRLALPIFAYMIAEGCWYTKNRKRYLLTMVSVAAVCQLVYFFAMQSLYQCIFVTFSLSICVIYMIEYVRKKRSVFRYALLVVLLLAIVCITEVLPRLLTNSDFAVDYGFWGVFLPVAVYMGKNRMHKLFHAALIVALLGLEIGGIQWYAFLALPLLVLYNGKRGKLRMKYIFYVYYPVHLCVIYFMSFWV